MALKYLPQFKTTTLNVGGGIDASQTTGIILQSVTGVDITKPGVTCLSWSNPLDTDVCEWVTYTSIDGSNELQGVVRGAEGSTGRAHANNVAIAFPVSKSHINDLNDAFLVEHNDAGEHTVSITDWISSGETWTYASADDPTFTFTIAGEDLTSKYSAGMKIKLSQTSVKYFIITAVAFSTDTTITIYGGTDYDLANAEITSPAYSTAKSPAGFPLDPLKWTHEATDSSDRAQSNPVSGTWYNLGTFTTAIPIGCWNVSYSAAFQIGEGTAGTCIVNSTLSTNNNGATDTGFTTYITANVNTAGGYEVSRSKFLTLSSKTSYYLNFRVQVANIDSIGSLNSTGHPAVIRAVCAYL